MRPIGASLAVAAIAGGILMSAGCSPRAKAARNLARAGEYVKGEKYREAAIEYMNVLKGDPTNRLAVRGMGLVLYQMGDVRAAMPYLLRAEEQAPGDDDVRLKLGSLYLALGDGPRARKRAESVLKTSSGNLDALVLWAATVSTSNEVATAIARLKATAGPLDGSPKLQVMLASLYARQGNFAAAEEIYEKALKRNPKAWEIHLAWGDLHMLRRNSVRAGEEYQAAADLAPVNSMARVRLARHRWDTGKHAVARQILDDLLKQAPQSGAAALARAEIALAERDYDTATGLLGRALKEAPSNLEAFLLLQRVRLAQGKTDEAIAAYAKLVEAFPTAAQGRYLLGLAWLQKGDVRKAIGEWERSVALDATHRDTLRILADLYVRTGQPDLALAVLKPFIARHPHEGFAYALIGAAYGAKKDFVQAVDSYRSFVRLTPGNPQGPHFLGQALRKLGRDAEATAMFEEALRIDPGFVNALGQLAEMMAARDKKWDAAVARIGQQIEKVPDAAGVYYLLGSILSQKGDWDKAEGAFQKAVELKPEISAAYLGLSRVYVAMHKEAQALEKIDRALAVNSNDVAALMVKGMLLTGRKDRANAAAQYQRILTLNPSFVPALNNLACLYQEEDSTRAKAFELAKRARDIAPRDPRVADTLGWAVYDRGDYKWALTLLQEGAGQMADQPEALYHLGMCQAALGDEENARESLSRALALAGTFSGSSDAEEMLAVLSAGETLQEFSAAGQVEAFLAKHPDNRLALLKAGAFYERTGDYERARALYEKAAAMQGRFVPALVRLARLCAGPLKQLDRAMDYARQAREEAPGDPQTAETLASIAFQKGDYKWAQSLLVESIDQTGATPERQYLLGMARYAMGKTEEATNLIGQALSASAGFASAPVAKRPLLMHLAGACARRGEKARARSLCEQVVARYPDFSPAFRQLAIAYAGQKTFSDQEFKALARARELLPDDPDVGSALGEAAYAKGQYEWASRLLQESTVRFPDRADLHYYLGMSYQQVKNRAAAQKALRRALELDAQSEFAPAAREYLKQTK
jgi:tetratricopeptide (TPR) repeat protein